MRDQLKPLILIAAAFLAAFFMPDQVVGGPPGAALGLLRWYAREHVILCLVPALFIAGAVSVFVSSGAVMKYLGAGARKRVAYPVASVGGIVLSVCSCTILPLFAGIYRLGAGLGPATAFLYAGPAINLLAIALTARVLGVQIGIARAVGAVLFSIAIGLLMHFFFRDDSEGKAEPPQPVGDGVGGIRVVMLIGALTAILVFATLSPNAESAGFSLGGLKWWLTGAAGLFLGAVMVSGFGLRWWKVMAIAAPTALLAFKAPSPLAAFSFAAIGISLAAGSERGELRHWLASTWTLARMILPLLFVGIFAAGILLGRPGQAGLIPSEWIASLVGGNSIGANLFASIAGMFMYFATLTEVPILQGLLAAGMGQGPALALLLAGPALSLPSILVLGKVMGARKTAVFVTLVALMAALTGIIYGLLTA